MNRNFESILRFVNLTSSGLLAGSLGFGEAALVPGWQRELSREECPSPDASGYFNAIGPLALATAVTLAVASRGARRAGRLLDTASAVGLAGVLATTMMVTVPINQQLDERPPADYESDHSHSLVRNWGLAHAVRTTLGISAFVCAVASLVSTRHRR